LDFEVDFQTKYLSNLVKVRLALTGLSCQCPIKLN